MVGKFGDIIGEVYSDGVNSQTLFDTASVTKIMVTTNLALIAAEQKKLNITDKVSKFLPRPSVIRFDGFQPAHPYYWACFKRFHR